MEESDKYFAAKIKEKLCRKFMNQSLDSIESMVKYEINQEKMITLINGKCSITKMVPIINIKCSQAEINKFNKWFYNDNIFPIAISGENIFNNINKRNIRDLLSKISELADCDLIILHNITQGLENVELSIEFCSSEFKLSYKIGFIRVEKSYQEIEAIYKEILTLMG